MRQEASRIHGVLAALIVGSVVLLWSAVSFAGTPSLGLDCGTGASLAGSDEAGKVTLGADAGTCTLTFSVPPLNPPACTAMNETNGGGYSVPVGTRTTTTTVQFNSVSPWNAGDVISYICIGY